MFDPLVTISLTLMTLLKIFAENFCFTFSIANMAENETQRKLQTMIECISSLKHDKGMNRKVYI